MALYFTADIQRGYLSCLFIPSKLASCWNS